MLGILSLAFCPSNIKIKARFDLSTKMIDLFPLNSLSIQHQSLYFPILLAIKLTRVFSINTTLKIYHSKFSSVDPATLSDIFAFFDKKKEPNLVTLTPKQVSVEQSYLKGRKHKFLF